MPTPTSPGVRIRPPEAPWCENGGMTRPFTCQRCHTECVTEQTRGRLPLFCTRCVAAGAITERNAALRVSRKEAAKKDKRKVPVQVRPPRPPTKKSPSVKRSPFNSTPTTAPGPSAEIVVGILERKVRADLEAADHRLHPFADSVAAMAITLARAADGCPPTDVRGLLQVTKELRNLMETIGGPVTPPSPPAGTIPPDPTPSEPGDFPHVESAPSEGPFGAVRPEVVDPPPVRAPDLGPVLGQGGSETRPALHAVAAASG